MTTNCIIVLSEKERKDIPKFENEIRTAVNPSKNQLCVCFQHNITDADLNLFDAMLKKKKPTLLFFSGVRICQIEKLAVRAKKRFPNVKFLSDTTTTSSKVQIEHAPKISYELIEPHLTPEELAVAV